MHHRNSIKMGFLNASALYLLALLPIVALLQFLKLRRQRYFVPSVMFWLEAVEDMKANVPFRRHSNSLLFALQLFFVFVAVISVARPTLRRSAALQGQSILIIENSASMQSRELGDTRLDIAKTKALELISRLDETSQMLIMDTSRPPHHIHQGLTTDKEKLRRAIAKITPQHTSVNLKLIFDSTRAYVGNPNTIVFFIGDNAEVFPNSEKYRYIPVGATPNNVGIVNFHASRHPETPSRFQILTGLHNFGTQEITFRVRLDIGRTWFDDETLTLQANEVKSIVFTFDDNGFDGLIASTRLELDDDLELDNIASALLHRPSRSNVLLVSSRSQPLLKKMLMTNANISFEQIQPQEYREREDQDIIIFDQFIPENLPEVNSIFLDPIDGLPFMPIKSTTGLVRVIDQEQGHSMTKNSSLIDMQVRKSLIPQLPIWGITLVETTQGPLIWYGEHSTGKVVVFAFDAFNLQISRFALSIPSAPIFMSRCLEWLSRPKTPIPPDSLRVGAPVRISVNTPNLQKRLTVEFPDKSRTNVVLQSSPFTFTDTTQVGVYTVFVEEHQLGQFVVNFLNPEESRLSQPRKENDPQRSISAQSNGLTREKQVNREIWKYTVGFSVLLLLVEWYLYHRKQ